MKNKSTNRVLLEGTQIHHWYVGAYLGAGRYLCKCSCGTVKSITSKALVKNDTKSCGCRRSSWTKAIIKKFKPEDKYE